MPEASFFPTSKLIDKSISISPFMLLPEVVSISPVIAALVPERNAFFPESFINALPAASRIYISGFINLKIATVLRISLSVSFEIRGCEKGIV